MAAFVMICFNWLGCCIVSDSLANNIIFHGYFKRDSRVLSYPCLFSHHLVPCLLIKFDLNSSPIDELGEDAFESR